jgi:hypothetical protein
MTDRAAHVGDLAGRQLGPIERMNARKGIKRLPHELERGERVELLGVGELPRQGGRLRIGRDVVLVAVTDRGLLMVGSDRVERLRFDEIAGVSGGHKMTGGRVAVTAADGRRFDLRPLQPQGRAVELIELVGERATGTGR